MGVGDVDPLPGEPEVLVAEAGAWTVSTGPFLEPAGRAEPVVDLGFRRPVVAPFGLFPDRRIRIFHSSSVTSMVAEQARAQRTPIGPGMFSASAAAAQDVTSGWSRARDRDANSRTVPQVSLVRYLPAPTTSSAVSRWPDVAVLRPRSRVTLHSGGSTVRNKRLTGVKRWNAPRPRTRTYGTSAQIEDRETVEPLELLQAGRQAAGRLLQDLP